MPRHASGEGARAVCDRCGLDGPYLDMVTERVTNLRVHQRCEDEPLPKPRLKVDATGLRHPRPDHFEAIEEEDE